MRAFDHTVEVLTGLRDDLRLGTADSHKFLLPLVAAVETALTDDFEKSALGNPAALTVEAAPKKDPLHEAGRSLAVAVTGLGGRGPADEVRITTTETTENVVAESDELYLG